MASYDELFSLQNDSGLKNRVQVACIVAAETIRGEDGGTANHANRLLWAAAVFQNPSQEANRLFWAVLAANKDATAAQITGATDAAVQANVDAAVDLFATG
jgi:hypothetical protein